MIVRTWLGASLLIALLVAPAQAGSECGGLNEFCCSQDRCDAGLACVPLDTGGAKCVPCGASAEPCCAGECDNAELACVNDICGDCGGPGLGCCDGSPSCAEGFICLDEDCVRCGQEAGQPCCGVDSEDECREGLKCDGQRCEACGDVGLQCCDNDTCPEDGTCIDGTCQSALPVGSPAPTMGGTGLAMMAVFLVAIGVYGMRRRRAA